MLAMAKTMPGPERVLNFRRPGNKPPVDPLSLLADPQGNPAMNHLDKLFKNNRNWVQHVHKEDPQFFAQLAGSRIPNTCGSAAPTAAYLPTRSPA